MNPSENLIVKDRGSDISDEAQLPKLGRTIGLRVVIQMPTQASNITSVSCQNHVKLMARDMNFRTYNLHTR